VIIVNNFQILFLPPVMPEVWNSDTHFQTKITYLKCFKLKFKIRSIFILLQLKN